MFSDPSAHAQPMAGGSPSRRPNILFVVSDQHRPDWLGCAQAGVPVRTPTIDRLAARGVRLTRAYCPSPVCGPSRACLASGREYDSAGVLNHQVNYPLDQTTYYQLLRDSGCHVMGCGKFDLHKSTLNWGTNGQHLLEEWGFSEGIDSAGKWDALKKNAADQPRDPYMHYLKRHGLAEVHERDMRARGQYDGTGPTPLPEHAYGDNWIAEQALRLLRDAPQDRPWHLQVNFAGPHEPMDVTESMHRLYRDPDVAFPSPHDPDDRHPPEHHQEIRRNYAAMIENIDRRIAQMLEVLRERGELENTIVVYSSDHGEMLGDYGRWQKHCPYEASVGIPMVVSGPGMAAGVVSAALVSLIDLAATFLEAAGVDRPDTMQARSLWPVLSGRAQEHRTHVLSGLGPWRMVRDERYKLVTGFTRDMKIGHIMHTTELTGGVQLYDLQEDPLEDRDLAADRPEVVRRLVSLLEVDPPIEAGAAGDL